MMAKFHPATLRDWLISNAPESIRDDAVAATCRQGKRRGRILASVPTSKGPRVVGVWRAMMLELAPNRAGAFAMLWADEAERAAFGEARKWLESIVEAEGFKYRPQSIVRYAGGAPYEFNLCHHSVADSTLRTLAKVADIDADALGVRADG